MNIFSDIDAIRFILLEPNRFVCYLGAGASAEAGVPTAGQICKEIRDQLLAYELPAPKNQSAVTRWENERLKWNDPAQRYTTCIHEGYKAKAARVEFFRRKLQEIRPSFSHHAVAMLMARGLFKSTCITTNFDKLLESAFAQQGRMECQAIRTDAELEYWRNEPDKCYSLKLHGDYDTYNVLNTSDETIAISEPIKDAVERLLRNAGLAVIGTAGQEKSIHTLFDLLTSSSAAQAGVLSFGLLWGVYMDQPRPAGFTSAKLKKAVRQRIEGGEVGKDIVRMIERMNGGHLFGFFPIWGAGRFFFDLVKATRDKSLIGTAQLYLDHEMRLHHVFEHAGLPSASIDRHIDSLRQQRRRQTGAHALSPELAWKADNGSGLEVRLLYGDISSRSHMSHPEFENVRRAVMSPEDTFLSAGGGVALTLLQKAGASTILNELSKFAPIPHGSVAVTSGANLPVHYIFHAAAVEIRKDGSYCVSKEDVRRTMEEALRKAEVLEIGALWVPLIGAGVASLGPLQSLESILEAISTAPSNRPLTVMIAIFREKDVAREEAWEALRRNLPSSWSYS